VPDAETGDTIVTQIYEKRNGASSGRKEKPLTFRETPYFRHNCDSGEGMRIFRQGHHYKADDLLEFLDDGVYEGLMK